MMSCCLQQYGQMDLSVGEINQTTWSNCTKAVDTNNLYNENN